MQKSLKCQILTENNFLKINESKNKKKKETFEIPISRHLDDLEPDPSYFKGYISFIYIYLLLSGYGLMECS